MLFSFMKKLFIFLFGFCLAVQAVPTFTQAQIDDAMTKGLMKYTSVGSSPSTVLSSQAFHYLALVTHFNPTAKDSSNNFLKDRVLAHYRSMITGGNEPYCGQPLYAWSDGAVGQALLIMKNTPVLWSSLTAAEKADSDLLMAALAIASNWAFNDQNNFQTGLGNAGNFGKTYNPNFTQGDIGIMIAAAMYFGADQCNALFTNFSYTNYITQFNARNWTNIVRNWSATGKTLMENGGTDQFGGRGVGVKVPFIYCGIGLTDINGIFYATSVVGSPKPMYNFSVLNTGAAGRAYIISGHPSPVVGQLGMCYEFESTDGNGARSDALYCYEGWMNSLGTRASMMMMGTWGGPNQATVEGRMKVGTIDLMFKLHEGYHGAYLGASRDIYDTGLPAGKGYFYNKDIWDNFVNSGSTPVPTPPPGPVPTPPPGPVPTPPPVPAGPDVTVQIGALQVKFAVSNDWGSGFTANVTLTNTGTTVINGWALSFDLPVTITNHWSSSITSHSGKTYSFGPLSWNGRIAPRGSVNFGFTAEPGNLKTPPTNFKGTVQ